MEHKPWRISSWTKEADSFLGLITSRGVQENEPGNRQKSSLTQSLTREL